MNGSISDIQLCGFVTFPPGTVRGPYLNEFYSLLWMDHGSARIAVDGEEVVLEPGRVVFTPPGRATTFTFDWISSSVRLGYSMFTLSTPPSRMVYPIDEDGVIPPLLRHALWLESEQPAGWRNSFRTVMGYVLEALETGAAGTTIHDDDPLSLPVARAAAFVSTEWKDGILRSPTLPELAAAASVSPEHLARVFTRETGQPPLAALRRIRIWRAAELLRDSALRVQEIATRCGFSNEFHFSAAFRRETGMSPTRYRAGSGEEVTLPRRLRPLGDHLFGKDIFHWWPAES